MPYNPIALSRTQSDSDATTFFAACVTAGTTLNATQQTAIYNLIGGLKWGNLWSKMTAIYPFVGGTAGCHAINLKSPGTYNITWYNSPTHNSNGVTGNGTTQYGDTGLVPSSVLSQNSCHVSAYSRTELNALGYAIGASDGGATRRLGILPRYLGLNISAVNCATTLDTTNPSSVGFSVASRTASALQTASVRSRKLGSSTATSSVPPPVSLYILANNANGSLATLLAANLAFSSIGTGLTDSEAQLFSSIVQSYQTTLSRAV